MNKIKIFISQLIAAASRYSLLKIKISPSVTRKFKLTAKR